METEKPEKAMKSQEPSGTAGLFGDRNLWDAGRTDLGQLFRTRGETRETKGESCDFNVISMGLGFQWDFNWISMKFCWISWDFMGKTVGKKDWQSGETPWVFSNWDTPWSAVGGGRWEVGSNSPRREHLYMMCFVKLYLIYEFWIHNTWFKSKNNINEQLLFFNIMCINVCFSMANFDQVLSVCQIGLRIVRPVESAGATRSHI